MIGPRRDFRRRGGRCSRRISTPYSSAWRCDSSPGNDGSSEGEYSGSVQKFCDKKGKQKAHVSGETDQLTWCRREPQRLASYTFALQAFRRITLVLIHVLPRAWMPGALSRLLMTTAISAFGILPAATLSAAPRNSSRAA